MLRPPSSSNASIDSYLEKLSRWRFAPEGPLDAEPDWRSYSWVRRSAVRVLGENGVNHARTLVTRLMMPIARRTATRRHSAPARLHLGCGDHYLEGWCNVDLVGASVDLPWDLRYRLPFPDGSAAAIFHEHVIEHLDLRAASSLMAESARLLRPGGILRIGVPDFVTMMQSYMSDGRELERLRPGRPVRLLALDELVHGYGHRTLWDLELLSALLSEHGFEGAKACNFGESAIEPAPDWELRRHGTLYVEAVRAS